MAKRRREIEEEEKREMEKERREADRRRGREMEVGHHEGVGASEREIKYTMVTDS